MEANEKWRQKEKERSWKAAWMCAQDILKVVFWAAIIFALLSLLGGCSKNVVDVVEKVRVDSVYIGRTEKEVMVQRDSVLIKEKGDTIYEYRWKVVDRLVEKRDTMWRERVDSIPVVKVVEKEKKVVPKVAWCGWGLLVLFVGGVLVWGYVRRMV